MNASRPRAGKGRVRMKRVERCSGTGGIHRSGQGFRSYPIPNGSAEAEKVIAQLEDQPPSLPEAAVSLAAGLRCPLEMSAASDREEVMTSSRICSRVRV